MLVFCALRLRVTTDITTSCPPAPTTARRAVAPARRFGADAHADPRRRRRRSAAVRDGRRRAGGRGWRRTRRSAWLERGPTPALAEAVYKLYAPRLPYFVSDQPETEVPAALLRRGAGRARRARSSSRCRRRWRRWCRGWRRPIRSGGSRRSCAASNGRAPDRWTSTAISSSRRDRRHAIVFLGTRHSALRQRRAGAAARRDPARVRRREPAGGRRPDAGAGGRRADRRRRRAADARRPDAHLGAVDRGRAAGADRCCSGRCAASCWRSCPSSAGALAATTVGALAVRAGARDDAGDRLDADRRRDRLPDPAADPPRAVRPTSRPTRRSDRVWMGALLGGLTTAAGFVALAWTSFPGVREMAVTSAAGILAALAVTRYVLPPLLRGRPRRAPLLGARRPPRGDRALAWLRAPPRHSPRRSSAGRGVAVCARRPAAAALARFAGRAERRRPGAEGRDRSRARPRLARRRGAAGDRRRARRGAGAAHQRRRRRSGWSARARAAHGHSIDRRHRVAARVPVVGGSADAQPRRASRPSPTWPGARSPRWRAKGSSRTPSSRSAAPPPRCTRRPTRRRCASPTCEASPLAPSSGRSPSSSATRSGS